MARVTLSMKGRPHGIDVDPEMLVLHALSSAPGVKSPHFHTVGKPRQPIEIADVVLGTKPFLGDVTVPGMMHGRVLRPPAAGAVPLAVNEDSIRAIPGARAVHVDNFLAVVAVSEWDVIRAANTLKVTWSHPRAAIDRVAMETGMTRAARVIGTDYEFSYRSHASAACAVCDYRGDTATVWLGSQKPHATAQDVASLLKLPLENVRTIWVSDPGFHARPDAGDVAMDAALLSKTVGRPVRVRSGGAEKRGTAIA